MPEATPPPAGQADRLLGPGLRGATLAIWSMVGLAAFEGLAVAAALPDVGGDLGDLDLLPWVLTAFLVTSGVATVVAGPLIDGLGVRLLFRWSVVVFTAGGLAAAVAPTMALVVSARIVQGVGAGLVSAVGLSAVSLVYPQRLVGRAFASNSAIWGVMGVAGPGLAALLLSVASWRWIFGVNLPLGVLALVLGWRAFPDAVGRERPRLEVDVRGTVLVALFTVGMLAAVDAIGPASLAWLVATIAVAAAYHRHAARAERPVLRERHLLRQPFGPLGLSLALLLAGGIASQAYLPLYVRAGRGAGPGLTAWSILFYTVGWTTGAQLSSRMLDLRRPRDVIGTGFVVGVPALAVAGLAAGANLHLAVVFAGMFVAGVGTGAGTNAGLTLLREVSAADEVGRAVAAHQFLRNQGFAVGAAMGGAILLAVAAAELGSVDQVRALLAGAGEGSAGGGSADPQAVAAVVRRGYATATLAATGLAALGLVPLRSLRRHLAVLDAARADAAALRRRGS